MQREIDRYREAEVTGAYEVWIGKDDYLVRQTKFVWSGKSVESGAMIADVAIPKGSMITSVYTWSYFDFNEPIEIEAPTQLRPIFPPEGH